MALRMMVERWGLVYFTMEERSELKRLAERYLNVQSEDLIAPDVVLTPVCLGKAMQLAIVLNDGLLHEKVSAIASDVEAMRARGVVNAWGESRAQDKAADLLAGKPPTPPFSRDRQ